MRRIILHAANAARNSYACFSVPLCYWVGLGRWRFSTSLSPVRDCSFRAATSRPLSVSFGGPENPWGWASRVTAESASSRPIDPAPARARVQHASVKKEMTRSIVDGVADLSRRNAKSPEISTEIGGMHLRRRCHGSTAGRHRVSHKARRAPLKADAGPGSIVMLQLGGPAEEPPLIPRTWSRHG